MISERDKSKLNISKSDLWSQSYDRELQRRRCKNLQRHQGDQIGRIFAYWVIAFFG
jgi:uncharacterized lipoprotein YmbA